MWRARGACGDVTRFLPDPLMRCRVFRARCWPEWGRDVRPALERLVAEELAGLIGWADESEGECRGR